MGRGPYRNLRAKATFATETKRVYFRLDALDSGLLILGYKVRSANFVLRRTTKLVVRTNDVANILETFGKVKLKKFILMHEISKWQTVVKGKSIRSDTRQFPAGLTHTLHPNCVSWANVFVEFAGILMTPGHTELCPKFELPKFGIQTKN